MDNNSTKPTSPFKIGFRFLANDGYVHQVTRFTEKRAYTARVENTDKVRRSYNHIALLQGAAARIYGLRLVGSIQSGPYYENPMYWHESRNNRVVAFPTTADVPALVAQANAAALPLLQEAATLRNRAAQLEHEAAILSLRVLLGDAEYGKEEDKQ